VAGSIGICGPTVRLSENEIEVMGRLLVREAAALSRALGQSVATVGDGGGKAPPVDDGGGMPAGAARRKSASAPVSRPGRRVGSGAS
jgi:hypothetical protein